MKISNEIVKQQFVQREYGLAHSTYDNELDFYQLVSSGDVKALSGMLLTGDEDEAVLASRGILSDDKVRNRRYHEIVLVAINFFNGECRVVVIPKYDNDNQCELHLVGEKKQLDKQQMEEYLYSRLPYYMIPKHMHCLEQFPLNTSSKTDRKKIQELI
jgi:hypothetical protein